MVAERLSILIVDDDVVLSRGLCRSLNQHGFNVHAVHRASDTLEYVKNNSVDVILLDWILPDRDGVALLQHMRDRGVTATVIMLTGENAVEDRVRALNRGADDYLVKPFDIEELIARIHAQMRRVVNSCTEEQVQRFTNTFSGSRVGRISVDAWKQEVSVDGERLDLTPIEYAILTHLIRNADAFVNKSQLVEAVWTDKGGSAKALDIHLTRLRRKLGSAAEQLETIRGTGVRLHS